MKIVKLALQFNHGVEIGARLAYEGHHARTKDPKVLEISKEEKSHQRLLALMLKWDFQAKPSRAIDAIFTLIGRSVSKFCAIMPLWSLNLVARSLELFAIFSYQMLAKYHTKRAGVLTHMARNEKEHGDYFNGL